MFPNDLEYLVLDIDDSPEEDIKRYFDTCIDFILKDEGKVLVHCVSGISRSGTIAIAYVMKTQNMGVEEAWAYVREHRPIVHPNSGF